MTVVELSDIIIKKCQERGLGITMPYLQTITVLLYLLNYPKIEKCDVNLNVESFLYFDEINKKYDVPFMVNLSTLKTKRTDKEFAQLYKELENKGISEDVEVFLWMLMRGDYPTQIESFNKVTIQNFAKRLSALYADMVTSGCVPDFWIEQSIFEYRDFDGIKEYFEFCRNVYIHDVLDEEEIFIVGEYL